MKKIFKSKTFILTFALLFLLQNVQAFAGTNTISYSASTTSIKVNQASTSLAISSLKVAVKSFSINKASLSVPIGYKETLRTTMLPSNATNKKINWQSSNPKIVKVDANGIITALAAGKTAIWARSRIIKWKLKIL